MSTDNEGEGSGAVGFQGETFDHRHQEVRAHVPYLVYLSAELGHRSHQWNNRQAGGRKFVIIVFDSRCRIPAWWLACRSTHSSTRWT